MVAAGERSAPRGTLTVTAPELPGEAVLRPILDAFMDAFPAVSARLQLTDRAVKMIDEGVDIALRIAHLPDSTAIAIRVGEVRRVVAAAPHYLTRRPRIAQPGELARHQIIATSQFGLDSWNFPPLPGSCVPRTIHFTPRLMINSVRAAIASAVEGCGIIRAFSCQIAEHVRAGELEILLAEDEEPPVPVHLLAPTGRLAVPKARAFVDFAVPRLRRYFASPAADTRQTPVHSHYGNEPIGACGLAPAVMQPGGTGLVRPDCAPAPPSQTAIFPRVHAMPPGSPNQRDLASVA